MTTFRRIFRTGLLGLVLAATSAGLAAASERCVALSIGVSAYVSNSPLAGPVPDAEGFAAEIGQFGCEVTVVRDPNVEGFGRAMERFVQQARGADRAIVFYSGHGVQANGEAYFLPTDARPGNDVSLFRREYMSVSSVLERLAEAGVGFRWIIVDACRNNPWFQNGRMGQATAMATAGLAETRDVGTHAMVSFASAPGELSRDWHGLIGLSLYTAALLDVLRRADRIDVRDLLQEARGLTQKTIEARTGQRQRPWEVSSMIRAEHLVRRAPRAPATPRLEAAAR